MKRYSNGQGFTISFWLSLESKVCPTASVHCFLVSVPDLFSLALCPLLKQAANFSAQNLLKPQRQWCVSILSRQGQLYPVQ